MDNQTSPDQTEQTTDAPAAAITVVDLQSLKACVEMACQRGAFRADEMTKIGELYDKLSAFLNIIKIQSPAQPQSENPQGE